MISGNSFSITRRFDGRIVTVIAKRVEDTGAREMRCYEGRALLNAYQDDDPWQAARAMIETAFIDGEGEDGEGPTSE